jgi:hypothetical protein
MKLTKKITKREKKLKTRCLRYRKGKCVRRYSKKQIKMLLSLQKEYKQFKKSRKSKIFM